MSWATLFPSEGHTRPSPKQSNSLHFGLRNTRFCFFCVPVGLLWGFFFPLNACHLAHTCVSSKRQDLHCVEQVTFKTTWYSWKQLKCFIGLFHKSKVPRACKGHIFWCREAPLLLPAALAVPNNCSPSQPSCLRPVLCSPCFPICSSWGVSHSPARSVFQRRLLCD